MYYQITELKIPKNIENDYSTTIWPNDRISNLSRLNVFIGPNNSGKSRLIRELFAEDALNFVPNIPAALKVIEDASFISNYVDSKMKNHPEKGFFKDFLEKYRTPTFREKSNSIQDYNVTYRFVVDAHRTANMRMIDHGVLRSRLSSLQNNLNQYHKVTEDSNLKKIYIPALRGLRTHGSKPDFYRKRTIDDYFKNVTRFNKEPDNLRDYEIITGLEMYDQVKKHLLGDLTKREIIADYQKYLGENFFNNEDIVLIPRMNSDVLFVKIGNEKEMPIYDLGDGIQHMIILTLPMFIHRDRKLLMFIEEPELFMHPGFQRLFIETVLEGTQQLNRQVFVATHSSQFLDLTLDEEHISVYKLKKQLPKETKLNKAMLPKFEVENSSNDDFSILEELGIRNSSVMLANCTIWVEGITDRLYLRKYLEIYQSSKENKLIEDMHYSFVEYGGANLVHWSFLEKKEEKILALRISNRIFLIRDKDGGKNTPTHSSLKESLQENYHRLTSREIENTLAPNIIKKVIKEYVGPDVEIKAFGKSDYKDEKLGNYIDKVLLEDKQTRKFRTNSGTIKDKVSFAQKAINYIETEDDISEEALNLTKKIYSFIKRHND